MQEFFYDEDKAAAAMVLFLAGGLCGIFMEKRQTTDVLNRVGTQIERIQTPVATVAVLAKKTKRGERQ